MEVEMNKATSEGTADAILGFEHERAILAAIWLDLVLDRSISEETNGLLASHFAPQFSAVVKGINGPRLDSPRRIAYALQVTPSSQIAMEVEADASGKHLRLDMNSKPVRAFLDEARTILLNYLHRAFPKGEVKSSFAYEAKRLIDKQQQEDPK